MQKNDTIKVIGTLKSACNHWLSCRSTKIKVNSVAETEKLLKSEKKKF